LATVRLGAAGCRFGAKQFRAQFGEIVAAMTARRMIGPRLTSRFPAAQLF